MPTAPDPAHRSRNLAPSIRGAMTLNSVSRRRSDVGRTFIDGGLFRFLPLYSPAIILIKTQFTKSTYATTQKAHSQPILFCAFCSFVPFVITRSALIQNVDPP